MKPRNGTAPWDRWEKPPADGEIATYCALRAAIFRKEQVVGLHRGAFLSFCPLALGVWHGRRVVLAYVIVAEYGTDALEDASNLPPRCRMLGVGDLHIVKRSRGLWPLWVGIEPLPGGFDVDVQAD